MKCNCNCLEIKTYIICDKLSRPFGDETGRGRDQRLTWLGSEKMGKKVLDKLDEKEIAELDTNQIMMKQVAEIENEKRLLATRLKAQEKRMDHMERAKRQEEIPLLQESLKNDLDAAAAKRLEREREAEEKLLAKERPEPGPRDQRDFRDWRKDDRRNDRRDDRRGADEQGWRRRETRDVSPGHRRGPRDDRRDERRGVRHDDTHDGLGFML